VGCTGRLAPVDLDPCGGLQQRAAARELGVAMPIGQKAEVPNAPEARRDHVQELCGGPNYVARPSASPILPQR